MDTPCAVKPSRQARMCRGIADSSTVIPGALIPNPLTACSVWAIAFAVNVALQDAMRGATAASSALASGDAERLAYSRSLSASARGLAPCRVVKDESDEALTRDVVENSTANANSSGGCRCGSRHENTDAGDPAMPSRARRVQHCPDVLAPIFSARRLLRTNARETSIII